MGNADRSKSPSADTYDSLQQEIDDLKKTTRKLQKTIKDLKESEEFFKAITQNSTDIIIIVNKTGQITYVNPAIERLMGYMPEELIGKSAFNYISKTDLPRAVYDFSKAVLTKSSVIPNSFGVKHKDGSIRILEGVGKSMFDNPAVKGFVMNVRDVTQRKKAEEELTSYHMRLKELVDDRTAELDKINEQLRLELAERKRAEEELRKSEERFRTLIQKSSDVISIFDKKGRFVYNSPSAETVFGYAPGALLGKSPFEFIHPDDLTETKNAYRAVLNHTHPGIPTEFRFRKGDSSWIHVESLGQNLLDYPGIDGIVITSRDVTERKRAQAELHASEAKYQSIFDTTGTGMLIVQEDMTISLVNAEFEKITGYTRQEIEGRRKWTEFVHQEDLEWMIAQHKLRRSNNKNLARKSYEFRLLPKNGQLKNIYLTIDLIAGTQKSVASMLDITEKKKAENAKRESEQMIKSILAAAPVGIGLTAERKIKWVNATWMQMFGFEEEKDCVDLPVAALYSSAESYEESRRRIYKILETSKIAIIEAYMARQDGMLFPAQINVAPLDPSDIRRGAISTIVDISEWKQMEQSLRESEERYRLAMEASNDGLWDWDIANGAVSYSPAWYKIHGAHIENYFSCWGSGVHPDDRGSLFHSLKDHLEGKSESWSHEYRVKTESEKWKWVLGRGSVILRDPDGKPLRMVGTVIDIDDRKILETQLVQAQKMEAIGTLAGGIAHDFNNILGSISGYTELSMLKNRSEEARDNYLQHVLKACDRAKNLVNQILLFSRQREGEKKPVDVTLIVKEALKLLRASLPSTIKINLNASTDAHLVIADPTHIHQIIMNLCTNAAHAMRDNGGMLDVTISRFLASGKTNFINPGFKIGPYIHLQVTDTGHGIDPSILEKIFDPFFTTKKQGEGTGLGLSVVYGIIKSYEGIVNVDSKVGRGSTFDIYLPCVDTENQKIEEAYHDVSLKGSERILVVDDEEDLVAVMDKYLSSIGYDVTISTSSPEALRIFRDTPHHFDLIITDMTMPQMTGLKLSQEIHTTRPEIPIILSTGYEVSITETEAKENGIQEFVMKPIRFSEFSVLIRNVLDRPTS
ncbi:MAG: PAS domain S-box protein [Syntrophaceae bacterium]|nr:PAS domain S-box protein [Syntrophaceae bacterium]